MDVLQGQGRLHEPVVQSKSARGSGPGKKKQNVALAWRELARREHEAWLMTPKITSIPSPNERRAVRDGGRAMRCALPIFHTVSPGVVDQNRRLVCGSPCWLLLGCVLAQAVEDASKNCSKLTSKPA